MRISLNRLPRTTGQPKRRLPRLPRIEHIQVPPAPPQLNHLPTKSHHQVLVIRLQIPQHQRHNPIPSQPKRHPPSDRRVVGGDEGTPGQVEAIGVGDLDASHWPRRHLASSNHIATGGPGRIADRPLRMNDMLALKTEHLVGRGETDRPLRTAVAAVQHRPALAKSGPVPETGDELEHILRQPSAGRGVLDLPAGRGNRAIRVEQSGQQFSPLPIRRTQVQRRNVLVTQYAELPENLRQTDTLLDRFPVSTADTADARWVHTRCLLFGSARRCPGRSSSVGAALCRHPARRRGRRDRAGASPCAVPDLASRGLRDWPCHRPPATLRAPQSSPAPSLASAHADHLGPTQRFVHRG